MPPIRCEGDGIHEARVAGNAANFLAGRGVPQVDVVIVAPGHERAAVARQRQAVQIEAMAESLDFRAALHVPQPGGRVPACREDLTAVGMKSDGPDLLRVAAE